LYQGSVNQVEAIGKRTDKDKRLPGEEAREKVVGRFSLSNEKGERTTTCSEVEEGLMAGGKTPTPATRGDSQESE